MPQRVFRYFFSFLVISFLSLFVFSCDEEEDSQVSVLTEDVFFIGADKVRILARVIANTSLSIVDHGFEISTDATFSNPIVKSLGDKSNPGRFISEVSGLTINTEYFVRSYLKLASGEFVSEALRIRTLIPQFIDFKPKFAFAGETMVINGSNFTEDTKVFFGEVPAQIVDINFESIIQIRIPPIGNNIKPNIRIVNQNTELTSVEPFEYIVGKFSPVAIFPFDRRFLQNVGFTINNKLVVGLGINESSVPNTRVWSYDLNLSQFNELSFSGRPHVNGFSSGGYFGGGALNAFRFDMLTDDLFNRDFWYFDGTSFQAKASLPFKAHGAIGFTIGEYVYVIGGSDPSIARQAYRYHIISNTWERIPDASFTINNSMANFIHANKIYVVGLDLSLYEFNPSNNVWRIVSRFPGSNTQGGGVAVTVGDRAFVGMYRRANEIWELSMIDFTWKQKTRFIGDTFASNAAIYSHQGNVFILRSKDIGNPTPGPMELIKFEPDGF